MKSATPTNDTEQQRRREATRLLTLRYLAMKESRRDVMDMLVEDRAESIMEQVRERLASAAGRYDGKRK